MTPKGKLIWQPELLIPQCGFKVFLDGEFAKEMLKHPLSGENQKRMNELGKEKAKKWRFDWAEPYNFFNNSCLIQQVYLGRNGLWLSTSCSGLEGLSKEKDSKPSKPIEYDAHNVDIPENAYALMYLFNQWIEYTDILKENPK